MRRYFDGLTHAEPKQSNKAHQPGNLTENDRETLDLYGQKGGDYDVSDEDDGYAQIPV